MTNDWLADGITRLRNGSVRGLEKVSLNRTNLVLQVLDKLQSLGFIENFSCGENNRDVEVRLKYYDNKPVIKYIKKISKCSRRMYSGIDSLPKSKSSFGVFILSTNKGVLSHMEAKRQKAGGELLLEVF